MRRAFAVLALIALLVAVAAVPAVAHGARVYVGALPGGGKVKLRIAHGRVRAKVAIPASCNTGREYTYRDKGLHGDVERHRVSVSYAVFADNGFGGGESITFYLRGRINRFHVAGSVEHEHSRYGEHPDGGGPGKAHSAGSPGNFRCKSGKLRFDALRRR